MKQKATKTLTWHTLSRYSSKILFVFFSFRLVHWSDLLLSVYTSIPGTFVIFTSRTHQNEYRWILSRNFSVELSFLNMHWTIVDNIKFHFMIQFHIRLCTSVDSIPVCKAITNKWLDYHMFLFEFINNQIIRWLQFCEWSSFFYWRVNFGIVRKYYYDNNAIFLYRKSVLLKNHCFICMPCLFFLEIKNHITLLFSAWKTCFDKLHIFNNFHCILFFIIYY